MAKKKIVMLFCSLAKILNALVIVMQTGKGSMVVTIDFPRFLQYNANWKKFISKNSECLSFVMQTIKGSIEMFLKVNHLVS